MSSGGQATLRDLDRCFKGGPRYVDNVCLALDILEVEDLWESIRHQIYVGHACVVHVGDGRAALRNVSQPTTEQGPAVALGALETFLGDTVLMASPVKGVDTYASSAKDS
jgi:hypothetical protein